MSIGASTSTKKGGSLAEMARLIYQLAFDTDERGHEEDGERPFFEDEVERTASAAPTHLS